MWQVCSDSGAYFFALAQNLKIAETVLPSQLSEILLQRERESYIFSFFPWIHLLVGWCCRHQSMTQSLCFFTNSIRWKIQYKLAVRDVHMFARDCTTIPHWRVPLVFGPWGLRSSSLSIIIITDRLSYTVVDCRRSSFSGRCCSSLERSTTSLHVTSVPSLRVFYGRLKIHLFNRFFLDFFCTSCEVTCVIIGHFNRFCYLLLMKF